VGTNEPVAWRRRRLVLPAAATPKECAQTAGAVVPEIGGRPRAPQPPVALVMNDNARTVGILGETFAFKPLSYQMLAFLMRRRGQWIAADILRREILCSCTQPGASNIRWHILQARRSMPGFEALIHSDRSLGYMFDLVPCRRAHCLTQS
jgi:DNA-binding response OmpR family regulator